ncbi:hypothetical protein BL254_12430 [Protofrankia sp. BMG5.30]|uniref:Uncharacterized protein n=2 Tax=Frankiaceae TaxID=74712 RepID=A0ABR5F0B5_9ACTN|nr:hypothetical protein FrCorBMG51_20090 [Protofrankia coriariae]ONH35234.1 hypothetical protein BL254_12430 [Protofrankia sp. BMG5.30]
MVGPIIREDSTGGTMKAPYQPPALQEVGTFPVVTEGYYGGHRRDYYGGYHKFRRFRRFRGFRHGY